MSMNQDVARMRISRDLSEAEEALDDALLKQNALFSTIIRARHETGVDRSLGQATLLRLSKAQYDLLSSGNNLCRVHANLKQIQSDIFGYEACPKNLPMRHASLDRAIDA